VGKMLVDVLSVLALLVLPSVFVPVSYGENGSDSIFATNILKGRLSGTVALMLLLHIVLLILERLSYIRRSLLIKWIVNLFEMLFFGAFFFFYNIYNYNVPFAKPSVAYVVYFLLRFISCFLSTIQIADGFVFSFFF
jgi:membrane-associated HD superfamily phosphohydrolase